MDYKKFYKLIPVSFIAAFCILVITGCSEKEKNIKENTFYIELVNFTNDSLRESAEDNIFGKISFYKNDKLQILSLNYVKEEFEKTHYYKSMAELGNKIDDNTKKIRVEFGGDYTADSISYSLQKFTYENKQWRKISDMGFIKSTNSYKKAKQFAIKEYGKQIMNNVAVYTYD